MPLTEGLDHEFLAAILSTASIQENVILGNITQDDANLATSLQVAELGGMLDNVVDAVDDAVSQLVIKIVETAPLSNPALFGLPFDLEDKIKDWINGALDPILGVISRIEGKIIASLSSTNDVIFESMRGFGLDIVQAVVGIADRTLGLADELEAKILRPVIDALEGAFTVFGQIDTKVKAAVTTAIAPIKAVGDRIFDEITGFATALRNALPALGSQLIEGLTDPLGLAADTLGDAVKKIIGGFFEDLAPEATRRIDPIITMFEEELSVAPELRAMTAPGALPLLAIGGLVAGFALPMILANVASTTLSPFAEKLRQRMNNLVRPTLMGAPDAISSGQRGFMDDPLVEVILNRQGYPDDQKKALIELVKLRPGTFDIIDYWRRDLLTDTQADTELHQLGWDDRYRDLLRQAAFPPPGVQDLIKMAVREVFSPEIAEQFGQFKEIPPAYLGWAKQVGLSEEWARNFWAAHWVLPSVQQGFEMLHRSVISGDDLERLFVALDVMPFWRKPLKDISFRPYTRVDVRRMFALGILDRAEVLRAYLELGFDDEKSENMTEFTVRYVESSRKVEKEKERDLTKGDIIGLFNDGLFNSAETFAQLVEMGFDTSEARLLIAREELQELRKDRKDDIAVIVNQAKIQVFTFQDAQDALNGLDLTRKEMSKAILDVTRATAERVRLPSKNDLDSWKALDLLTLDQYSQELDNLGFPAKYVALYVEESQLETAEDLLAAEERAAKRAEPRPITKGQLDTLLRTDIIDLDDYTTGLETLKFAPRTIDTFTLQIQLQIEEKRLEAEARAARGEEAAEKERLLGRVTLGKLVLVGIISFPAYREGLTQLGFATESVDLLVRLLELKVEENAESERSEEGSS